MFTVKKAAAALGISNTTLRQWGKDYAEYLSDHANPGFNKTRKYTEDDIAALMTVVVLKAQNASEDDILAALAAGEKLEPVELPGEPPPKRKTTIEGDTTALVTSEFAAALQSYETQLTRLQQKNDDLHERLLKMTERATVAETELRILREQSTPETPAASNVQSGAGSLAEDDNAPASSPTVKLSRWQRLRRRIAGMG
jgi:DNA-binding transcriptional MerR regulator